MRNLVICVLVVLGALPAAVAAQDLPTKVECSEYVPPEERNDAKRLALRGVACFEAEKYVLALKHYRRARELSDANLLNAALGRTFHELGYPFIAQRYYRDYLSGKIDDSEGRAKIEARLADVEKELESAARVRLESSPPGATVFIVINDSQWEELGETPMNVMMRPGKHSFVVERKGYVRHTAQVDAGSKQDRIVRAELVQDGAAFAVSGQRLRQSGIITMAASVPFLIVGTSLYFIGRNERGAVPELPEPERADAHKRAMRTQNFGVITGAVGVAALGTGLVLYLAGRAADTPEEKEVPEKGGKKTPKKRSGIWPYADGRTVGFAGEF